MSNKKDAEGIHGKPDDNVIQFPEPSTLGSAGCEEDVADESPPLFYFTPEWDTDGDDPAA